MSDNSGIKPPPPTRKISEDLQTQLQAVEKGLADRPEKKDLIDRGILKDDKGISPALLASREKLQRSQLEDKLEHALQARPKAEELVKEGILKEDEVPTETK